ncbi:GAF domain protein, partial [Vibrio parahaemolyticus VPTS-2010]
NVR